MPIDTTLVLTLPRILVTVHRLLPPLPPFLLLRRPPPHTLLLLPLLALLRGGEVGVQRDVDHAVGAELPVVVPLVVPHLARPPVPDPPLLVASSTYAVMTCHVG